VVAKRAVGAEEEEEEEEEEVVEVEEEPRVEEEQSMGEWRLWMTMSDVTLSFAVALARTL
jgi:hypothetical protein